MFNLSALADKIEELCDSKGITVSKMLEECGLNKSAVFSLKDGKVPSIEKIGVMARYFDMSISNFLGEPVPVSEDIEVLLTKHGLQNADRQALLDYLDYELEGLKAAAPLLEQRHD
jgi:transcriptional regulator with XRE-family HTH domain